MNSNPPSSSTDSAACATRGVSEKLPRELVPPFSCSTKLTGLLTADMEHLGMSRMMRTFWSLLSRAPRALNSSGSSFTSERSQHAGFSGEPGQEHRRTGLKPYRRFFRALLRRRGRLTQLLKCQFVTSKPLGDEPQRQLPSASNI